MENHDESKIDQLVADIKEQIKADNDHHNEVTNRHLESKIILKYHNDATLDYVLINQVTTCSTIDEDGVSEHKHTNNVLLYDEELGLIKRLFDQGVITFDD